MTEVMNHVSIGLYARLLTIKDRAVAEFDRALVRYDAWFIVLLAVLLTLAFVIATALAIWCVVYKGKRFRGNWRWSRYGVSVAAECV